LLRPWNLYLAGNVIDHILQPQRDPDLDVIPSLRTAPASAEELSENIIEPAEPGAPEDIREICTPEDVLLGTVPLVDCFLAVRVVLLSLFVVREDCVGFGDLLEFLLRTRVLVPVGVVLKGQFPVCALDLVL